MYLYLCLSFVLSHVNTLIFIFFIHIKIYFSFCLGVTLIIFLSTNLLYIFKIITKTFLVILIFTLIIILVKYGQARLNSNLVDIKVSQLSEHYKDKQDDLVKKHHVTAKSS